MSLTINPKYKYFYSTVQTVVGPFINKYTLQPIG